MKYCTNCDNDAAKDRTMCMPCLIKFANARRDYMRNRYRAKVGIPIDAPLLTWKRRPQFKNHFTNNLKG